MPEKVGCECGDFNSYSEYDKDYGQYYTQMECDKCNYYWEGYTLFELNKEPNKILCTNLESELLAESDKHMIRLLRCKDEDEITIEFARHITSEYFIKERYKEHDQELENGIDFGR